MTAVNLLVAKGFLYFEQIKCYIVKILGDDVHPFFCPRVAFEQVPVFINLLI